MIDGAKFKERGATPRKLAKIVTAAKRIAWHKVGTTFHGEMRPKRFTKEHAKAAGYYKRKGDNLAFGSKGWKRSTAGRKFKQTRKVLGADNPLVWSGKTRTNAEFGRVDATTKGVKVRYPQARALNYRNPKSRIDMRKEFLTLTAEEIDQLVRTFDETLDSELQKQGQ